MIENLKKKSLIAYFIERTEEMLRYLVTLAKLATFYL